MSLSCHNMVLISFRLHSNAKEISSNKTLLFNAPRVCAFRSPFQPEDADYTRIYFDIWELLY
jgi:hypothetical protein